MATVKFIYIEKCAAADPHIKLQVNINNVARGSLGLLLSEIWLGAVTEDEAAAAARVLLHSFARKWKRDNPTGTLPQLRTALEAQEWVI